MIHVDKEQEWDPFVKEVMDKFKELEVNQIIKVRISKKLSKLTSSLTEKFA